MSTDPFLFDLEVRGYVPFELGAELAAHVTTAVWRAGSFTTPHDLVLVVDRTSTEGLVGSASAPHRTSRRAGPFEMPFEAVVVLGKSLPTNVFASLARVTIIEIADVAPSREDLARIETYTSPSRGNVLVGAIYVNASGTAPAVHTNDGGSPYTTGLVHTTDLADVARRAYGAPRLDGASTDPVALFSPRTVGAITFVFSPIAGAALVAWNFHNTRRTGFGLTTFVGTFAALVAATGATTLITNEGAGYGGMLAVNIAAIFVCVRVTSEQFGTPIRKANAGIAIAIGVAALVAFSVAVSAIAIVTSTRVD